MKNNIIKLGMAFFIFLSITACEDIKFGNKFLEKPLSTELRLDSIFSKKMYADMVLANAYHSLPEFMVAKNKFGQFSLDALTDINDCNKPNGIYGYYDNQVSAAGNTAMPYALMPASTNPGRAPIYGIRQSYIYIENVDRVPDMTMEEKEIRKAEAKVLIGYHYSQMFRYYGPMPWIDHAYSPDDNFTAPRLTVEEMVNKICGLLDEAAAVLPWSVASADHGRMTAASALALKVRVLLFAASPLFNSSEPYMSGETADARITWYGDYSSDRWQRVIDACHQFLDHNKQAGDHYRLVDTGDPRNDFVNAWFKRDNREILVCSHGFRIWGQWQWCFSEIRYGVAAPTLNYVNMFDMKDGTPFSWDNPVHAANPFFDASGNTVRDPRLYETCVINGDKFQGRTAETYVGGREYNDQNFAKNGFGMRKHIRDRLTEIVGMSFEYSIFRLPELYLSLAEAMNEVGKGNVADKYGNTAYDYVDMVLNRVDMPDLDRSSISTGVELREAILTERALELAYEEVRYFDLNRWKRYDLYSQPLHKLVITKSGGNYTYNHTASTNVRRVWIENWTDKFYLIPIPENEINKKYGLIQNPGW